MLIVPTDGAQRVAASVDTNQELTVVFMFLFVEIRRWNDSAGSVSSSLSDVSQTDIGVPSCMSGTEPNFARHCPKVLSSIGPPLDVAMLTVWPLQRRHVRPSQLRHVCQPLADVSRCLIGQYIRRGGAYIYMSLAKCFPGDSALFTIQGTRLRATKISPDTHLMFL